MQLKWQWQQNLRGHTGKNGPGRIWALPGLGWSREAIMPQADCVLSTSRGLLKHSPGELNTLQQGFFQVRL